MINRPEIPSQEVTNDTHEQRRPALLERTFGYPKWDEGMAREISIRMYTLR